MPRRERDATDPASHHGFLDSVDDPRDEKTKKKRKRSSNDEGDALDLDRIL